MIHIWRQWKLSSFQDPPLPCPATSKIRRPLTLDVQFQTSLVPLQMITNQQIENIIQGCLLYVIRSFLEVGFYFQYKLINLVWLSIDFFPMKPTSSQELFWRTKILFFALLLQWKDVLRSRLSWSLTICLFVVLYSCVCSCREISRNVFYL